VHGSTTAVALIANAIDNGPDGLLDLVDGATRLPAGSRHHRRRQDHVADLEDEILIEHTRPAPEVTYVGNGRPRAKTPESSPMS
jgi:hypothetical protein